MSVVELERVVFREGVYVPAGRLPEGEEDAAIYGSKENVIGCWKRPTQLMSKQHFRITLDRDVGEVMLEHPVTHEIESIPISNVLQYRVKRTPKAKAEAKGGKAA